MSDNVHGHGVVSVVLITTSVARIVLAVSIENKYVLCTSAVEFLCWRGTLQIAACLAGGGHAFVRSLGGDEVSGGRWICM